MPPKNHGGRSHHGKKFRELQLHHDKQVVHGPREALTVVQHLAREANRNFDETIELALKLGVDPRRAEQQLRGTVSLPGGTGKNVRVAVFAAGEAAQEARDAGAEVIGADDLVSRIEGGFLDFDVAIATPDLMAQVGKLGKTLGPRGLMPNPKTGTVTTDVGKAVREFKGGMVEYRTDRAGNVHVPIGKASFDLAALHSNYLAVVEELQRARPAAAKGRYMRTITVSSTMGPGVKVDPMRAGEPFEEASAAAS